jgi:hypothetical protein
MSGIPDFLRDEELEKELVEKGKVTPQQEWCDSYLQSLPQEDLQCFILRVKKLTDEQKERRQELLANVEDLHASWMNETPKKQRFNCPGKGMLGARARDLFERRVKDGTEDKLVEFGPPKKQPSILDV